MKTWQKALIMTLITLTIGGSYLWYVFEQRRNPGVIGQESAEPKRDMDDVAIVRFYMPTTFDDTKRLEGTTVWMKNGYVIPYYSYEGRVEFNKRAGLIPAAQRLDIKKTIKSAIPASEDDGMSHGSRQAFAVFTLPGNPALYAMPIGVMDGSQEAYFCDALYYYDDPHTIYDNWPKYIWATVDAHQVKPGMSELETQMSIGRNMRAEGSEKGNRTVTFDQPGKKWTVTFVNNKATQIKSQ
jgi:hypothetical protein